MNRSTTFLCIAALVCLGSAANAQKPHPESAYPIADVDVVCECDWTSMTEGACTVSWDDVAAPTYGVDVEFEAEWTVDDVEMSAVSELDLDDNWACDGSTCSANGDFVLPDHPMDAEISFVGKVKGFDTGSGGAKPRDFSKATGDCNLL